MYISPHSAIESVDRALVPGREMLDGRTESDRLWYLTEFAGLINFYNSSNQVQGNWKPFLLKDPVFLLAYISKAPYDHFYSRYNDTCTAIASVIKNNVIGAKDILTAYKLLNQLFGRLKEVYDQIGCWAYYIQLSAEEYELGKYLLGLVKTTFSPHYWALKDMHSNLFSSLGETIKKDLRVLPEPEYFNNSLWLDNKCNGPWWQILGFRDKPASLAPVYDVDMNAVDYEACFNVLKKTGNNLFRFFKNAIANAGNDFEKMAAKKSKYPDTTLLRALVRLMQIHQQQLNGIAEKHLDFYYRDILQQREQPATPGSIYIAAVPKTTNSIIKLPAGTAFHVATNNSKAQVFCTLNEEVLHPVTIAGATTLSYVYKKGELLGLFREAISNISATQITEDGQVTSWRTFGGKADAAQPAAAMGVAFASPMLYLTDGFRTITFTFSFSSPQTDDLFTNAVLYLSTQKKWLEIPAGNCLQINYVDASGKVTSAGPYAGVRVIIMLDATHPAIENFTVNPDGISSKWPLLKILFNNINAGTTQSFVKALNISVAVSGVKSFQLYNDSGAITVKSPYTPFGSTPLPNSNFFIGSSEVFSKPFSTLSFEIDWNNLPKLQEKSADDLDDFETYYNSYNQYYSTHPAAVNAKATAAHSGIAAPVVKKSILQKLTAIFKQVVNKFRRAPALISKKISAFFSLQCAGHANVFNNGAFTAGFYLLQDANWIPFPMRAPGTYILPPVSFPGTNVVLASEKTYLPYNVPGALFRVNNEELLVGKSIFQMECIPPSYGYVPDPSFQTDGLNFTDKSFSGFMKIVLSGPVQGFGNAVYPKLVAYTAMQNAVNISSWSRFSFCKPVIVPPPNLPFVPVISNLTGTYTAAAAYDLSSQDEGYPLQCFSYSPFATYEVFNNVSGSAIGPAQAITTIAGPATTTIDGVAFFPAFSYDGALLLEFARLLPGNTISLYVELARVNTTGNAYGKVCYSYLSNKGWQSLGLLFDGTNNFACSGIIKLFIPGDITNSCTAMPGTSYWIALCAEGQPGAFLQTISITVNGIEIQQADVSFFKDLQQLQIKTAAAATTVAPVAPLQAVVKPLHAPAAVAENAELMNRRASTRIKTKDRIVTRADMYTQISRHFSDIFYAKIVNLYGDGFTGWNDDPIVKIYLVKKATGYSEPSALLPFVTTTEETEIRNWLHEKTPAFINLQVSNFEPQYVQVFIWITLQDEFKNEEGIVKLQVNKALKIYLSPWINSSQQQAAIDAPLTDAGVAGCVLDVEGVKAVSKVKFRTWAWADADMPEIILDVEATTVKPASVAHLFVSAVNHSIKFEKAA